jgi:hypothetical protein
MNLRWSIPAGIWGTILAVALLATVADQYRPISLLVRAAAVALTDPVLLVLALVAGFVARDARAFIALSLLAVLAAATAEALLHPVDPWGYSLAPQFVAGLGLASITWAMRPRPLSAG